MSRRPPAPTRTSPLFPYTPLFRSAGLDPSVALDARSYDLATVSIVMVVLLVALMMTGMPLGIVTLIVSVLMAIAFFGPRGLYLVSTHAARMLNHYTLVAIPFFVLMASISARDRKSVV